MPIPDNNATGASMSLTVPDNKTVLDVNVKVNITHTFDGDFTIQLFPRWVRPSCCPTGGGNGQNYTNTVFDDEAATPSPRDGALHRDLPARLAALRGGRDQRRGTWTLKVVDQANVDVGTIDNFTLSLTYPAQACGPHAGTTANADVSDVCSAAAEAAATVSGRRERTSPSRSR